MSNTSVFSVEWLIAANIIAQYYCLELIILLRITMQYFILFMGLREKSWWEILMLLCVATALALRLMRKEPPLYQRVVRTKTAIHTWKPRDGLNVEWAKRLQFFVQSDCPSFDAILKTVAPTLAKEILTLEKQQLSITLRYLDSGSNFEDLKFIRVISKAIGIVVLEICLLLGRQTVTGWILHNTVHTLFNIVHNTLCQIIDTMYCATLQYYP